MSRNADEADRIVARIDETRRTEYFRSPDRPDGHAVKRSRRQDPAVVRAKTRLRTANYRNRLDQRRSPSTYQIAMSLLVALVTSKGDQLTDEDRGLVGRALLDLKGRGFSIRETLEMLRRLQNRLVDTADRECGSTDSTSSPAF
jgi:hypothetical protein